jgi:hypothetical protein
LKEERTAGNDLDYFGIVACHLFPGGIPVTAGKTFSMIDTRSTQALMYLAHRYVSGKCPTKWIWPTLDTAGESFSTASLWEAWRAD